MMIKCSICLEDKVTEDFYFRNDTKKFYKWCKSCHSDKMKNHYSANTDYYKERHKKYYPENKEKYAEQRRRFASENPEKMKAYQKKYNQLNPHMQLALSAKRRARIVSQTPELSDKEKQSILDLYWLAKDLRAVSGQEYHVDHIIPLSRGGLHHPDNLQILPADLNLKKGAK